MENNNMDFTKLAKCPNCAKGDLFPIYDTPTEGANYVYLRGCFCTNASCNYNTIYKAGKLISFANIEQVETKDEGER